MAGSRGKPPLTPAVRQFLANYFRIKQGIFPMNDDDFDKNYIETVANLGKNLFRDFLGELTRKRQSFLLTASIITILISLAIATPIETSLIGIKFSFANTQILPLLLGSISLYFLLLYIASVIQDLQYSQYIELPTEYEYMLFFHKLLDIMVSHGNALSNILNDSTKQMHETYKASKEAEHRARQYSHEILVAASDMKKQAAPYDEIEKKSWKTKLMLKKH